MPINRILLLVGMFIASLFAIPQARPQTYSLPNNNAACPGSCRQIPWQAGSDLWNNAGPGNAGVLPNYTNVNCTGLTYDGSTDQTSAVQACINALSSGQASFIPGPSTKTNCLFINGELRLKSNTVLRGGGANTTFICLGASGELDTQNFSFSGGGLNPAVSFATLPSTFTLSGTPQKGDTTVTLSTVPGGGVAVGTWIKVFGNDNPALISATGGDGKCDWCGDNTGFYVMQQIVQITSYASGTGGAGSVANISRPLYYPPDTTSRVVPGSGGAGTVTEPAGAKYNIITFGTTKAGFENFYVTAKGDIGADQIIRLQGCLFCWVKGVQTYNTGSSSESAHVMLMESYGAEVRDSYFHDGRSSASGSNYGVYQEWVNGDHKIENNILRHNRHSQVNQGGGTGTVILYNYIDDDYTDDLTYLGSARTSHGGHPFFNLWEGNIVSHVAADDCWGTSSHFVFFRNWQWGDESGIGVPSFPPNNGFDAIDLYSAQPYYAMVGNVLGNTALHTTWSAATLRTFNPFAAPSTPDVYSYGGAAGSAGGCGTVGGSAPSSDTTSLNQGNWDMKTGGIAFNDGGANDTFAPSLYYSARPSAWWQVGGYTAPWPPIGSDLTGGNGSGSSGKANLNPARACYVNVMGSPNDPSAIFEATSCYSAASIASPPAPTPLIFAKGSFRVSGSVKEIR